MNGPVDQLYEWYLGHNEVFRTCTVVLLIEGVWCLDCLFGAGISAQLIWFADSRRSWSRNRMRTRTFDTEPELLDLQCAVCGTDTLDIGWALSVKSVGEGYQLKTLRQRLYPISLVSGV